MISLLLLLACGEKETDESTTEDTTTQDTDTQDTAPQSTPPPSFIGIDFILQSADGYSPIGDLIRLQFPQIENNNIDFNFDAGCNSIGGSFDYTNETMNINEMYATEIGCATELMEQDDWFVAFFNTQPTIQWDEETLTIANSQATFEFINEDTSVADVPLTDTRWVFDTFIDNDTMDTTSMEQYPYVEFSSTGSLSLFTGCNDGMGSYSVSGNQISVAIDQYTDLACSDDIHSVEGHVVSVFMGTMTFRIDGNYIELMNETKGLAGRAEE